MRHPKVNGGAQLSSEKGNLPSPRGTEGKEIVVRTDYFDVDVDGGQELFKYNVKITTSLQRTPPGAKVPEGKIHEELNYARQRTYTTLFHILQSTALAFPSGIVTDKTLMVVTLTKLDFQPA